MWNSKACNILKFIAWINLFIYLIAIMYCATVAILSEERYWTSLIIFILFVSTILQILILILLHDLSLDVYSHACSPSLQEPNGAPPEPHTQSNRRGSQVKKMYCEKDPFWANGTSIRIQKIQV